MPALASGPSSLHVFGQKVRAGEQQLLDALGQFVAVKGLEDDVIHARFQAAQMVVCADVGGQAQDWDVLVR
jgi:hypothetical protein